MSLPFQRMGPLPGVWALPAVEAQPGWPLPDAGVFLRVFSGAVKPSTVLLRSAVGFIGAWQVIYEHGRNAPDEVHEQLALLTFVIDQEAGGHAGGIEIPHGIDTKNSQAILRQIGLWGVADLGYGPYGASRNCSPTRARHVRRPVCHLTRDVPDMPGDCRLVHNWSTTEPRAAFRRRHENPSWPGQEGFYDGRADRIRTCDPLTPSQVRYQAAPQPAAPAWRVLDESTSRHPCSTKSAD